DAPGYDLLSVFIGSEGTFGIATRILLRLVPLPEGVKTVLAIFDSVPDACRGVTELLGRGILPAAVELIDQTTLRAVEAYIHGGVIPRTKLPEVLAEIARIGERQRVLIANVFHAGDGNLHPVVLYDEREPGVIDRVRAAGDQILELVLSVGGALSGEHGIGF